MKPHEERVVTEKADLDAKIIKLNAFIAAEMFKTIGQTDRDLLLEQRQYMDFYSKVLGVRIAHFTAPAEQAVKPGES